MTAPAILALDFDGVLCDGMREYFESAWHAYRRLRPAVPPEPPPGLFERFARLRPLVETGWEMPVLMHALLALIERLRGLGGGPVRIVVVTTKEGRFARKLLARQGVDLDPAQVYGKEARRPKRTILRELVADGDAARLWFVEDRIRTLEDVKQDEALAGAKLFLAAWGYTTADDREAAQRDARIVLLTLARFARDFPAWSAPGDERTLTRHAP